jgi:rhodanese-related sulfurtransferase
MKRITPQELQRELETGDALVLDVRSASAFGEATEHIPGDVRRNPDDLEQWADQLPKGRHVVAYCT